MSTHSTRHRPSSRHPDPTTDPPAPWYAQWAALLVAAVFVGGVVWAGLGHWRRGSVVMGAAMLLGAGLRGLLPARMLGVLVLRRRWFDVACLVVLGAGIVALAFLVPPKQ